MKKSTEYIVLAHLGFYLYHGINRKAAELIFKNSSKAFQLKKKDKNDEFWFVIAQKPYGKSNGKEDQERTLAMMFVDDVCREISEKINNFGDGCEPKNPYFRQFVLEEIVKELSKKI